MADRLPNNAALHDAPRRAEIARALTSRVLGKAGRRVLRLAIVIASLTGPFAAAGENNRAEPRVAVDSDVVKLGEQLRRDIDRQYDRLVVTGSLKISGHGRNFINDVFARYLSQGMPLTDAEALLRVAGFVLRARGKIPGDRGGPADIFVIESYGSQFPFGLTTVFVVLYPDDAQTWRSLRAYDASIHVASL